MNLLHRPYDPDRVGLYMYRRNDTYSTCEWSRLRSVGAFDTSLASQLFMIDFVYLKRLFAESITKQDFGQSAHQYSKFLASPER